eukprot:1766083-Pyramimonas_sp.AAC.1
MTTIRLTTGYWYSNPSDPPLSSCLLSLFPSYSSTFPPDSSPLLVSRSSFYFAHSILLFNRFPCSSSAPPLPWPIGLQVVGHAADLVAVPSPRGSGPHR